MGGGEIGGGLMLFHSIMSELKRIPYLWGGGPTDRVRKDRFFVKSPEKGECDKGMIISAFQSLPLLDAKVPR